MPLIVLSQGKYLTYMDNLSRILLHSILIEKFYKHSSTYIIYA